MTSRGLPRWAEAALAFGGLLATLPVVAVAAILVRATSAGPSFFRQTRVGLGGRPFALVKLRSMRASTPGSEVTVRGDARITTVGRWLRRTKLDELPQLWNVLRGDLSLVGPRPEVPAYVEPENPRWQRVLSVRPGLTDPVTLRLRDEESLLAELLAGLPDAAGNDAESVYRRYLQPWKLRGYVEYLEHRTVWSDLRCLLATALSPLGWSSGLPMDPPSKSEILGATNQSSDELNPPRGYTDGDA